MLRYGMLVALIVVVCLGAGVGDGITLKRDKENVVASELEGSWRIHTELSSRLWGSDKSKRGDVITFRADPAVAALVPERLADCMAGNEVFMAGFMTRRDKEHHFLLTSYHGNPYVVWAEVEERGPFANVESWNVMLAKGNGDTDLLFIGGDFNNQPFDAYERVSAPEPESSRAAWPLEDSPATQRISFRHVEGDVQVLGWVSEAVQDRGGTLRRLVAHTRTLAHLPTGSWSEFGSANVRMDAAHAVGGGVADGDTVRGVFITPRDGLNWSDVAVADDIVVKLERHR